MEIKIHRLTALFSHFVSLYFNAKLSFSYHHCFDKCVLFINNIDNQLDATVGVY